MVVDNDIDFVKIQELSDSIIKPNLCHTTFYIDYPHRQYRTRIEKSLNLSNHWKLIFKVWIYTHLIFVS